MSRFVTGGAQFHDNIFGVRANVSQCSMHITLYVSDDGVFVISKYIRHAFRFKRARGKLRLQIEGEHGTTIGTTTATFFGLSMWNAEIGNPHTLDDVEHARHYVQMSDVW